MSYTILIVDDSKLARMAVIKALNSLHPDWVRLEASNADEAVKFMSQSPQFALLLGQLGTGECTAYTDSSGNARQTCTGVAALPDWIQLALGLLVLGLAIHLSTDESIDPSFGQQWTGTEEGRRFLTLSSEAWYTANVAWGEDPAAARTSADRCIKAYLGEE